MAIVSPLATIYQASRRAECLTDCAGLPGRLEADL